ncbi:MAG: nuclear transport factor 2 family protein [Pseudomonadota bacterium]
MRSLTDRVRQEIEDLHVFFTEWFNGANEESELETYLLPRFHSDFTFISPDGVISDATELETGFRNGFGKSPGFRILIRDVLVRFVEGDHVLATYTEWQTGAKNAARPNNARCSTVFLAVREHIRWLHLQETWLPEAVQAAGPFDV